MGKSIWYILAMGMVALSLFMLGMCTTLDTFKDTPAGRRALLAEKTSRQFGFTAASLGLRDEGGRKTLQLAYETHADSKFDISLQRREMEQAAEFVCRNCDGKDRREIAEVSVHRIEVKGRGCWKESYVTEAVYVNPDHTPPPPPSVRQ